MRVLISVSRVRVLLYWLRDAAPTRITSFRAPDLLIARGPGEGDQLPPPETVVGARDHERISKICRVEVRF